MTDQGFGSGFVPFYFVSNTLVEMYIVYFSTLFRYKIIPAVVFKVKRIFSSRFYDSSFTAEM